jgi:hypothetical protein
MTLANIQSPSEAAQMGSLACMELNLVMTKNSLIDQLILVAQVGLAPFVSPRLVGCPSMLKRGRMAKCSTLLWYNASVTPPGWVKSFWWGPWDAMDEKSSPCLKHVGIFPSGPSSSLTSLLDRPSSSNLFFTNCWESFLYL